MALALALLGGAGAVALAAEVKISVKSTGIYAVTGAELAAAGVPIGEVSPEKVGLTCHGEAMARRVSGVTEGRLTEASTVVFYGEGLDTRYTDTNVYWLTWDGGNVVDMKPWSPGPAEARELRGFPCLRHIEENHEYGYLIWVPEEGELDPWFWQTIRAGDSATVTFDLPSLLAGGGKAEVRVLVRGRTSKPEIEPDHHVVVEVNGASVGDARFDSQAELLIGGEVSAASLKPAGNALTIKVPGDTDAKDLDQVFLDWVEVKYPRAPRLGPTGLTVTLPEGEGGRLKLEGVTGPAVDLYDVSVPTRPTFAAGLAATAGGLEVSIGGAGPHKLIVCPSGAHLTPEAVAPVARSHWRERSNAADYIIICHDDLLEAIQPLARYRSSQGLAVATVPLSDIYNEFGAGVVSPQAIRDFLRYAYREWRRPAARFVLLVGGANYDGRDYLQTGVRDLLPAYPVRVYDSIETPTDAYYVCVAGNDHVPEMAIGRLPFSTPEEVRLMCDKIIGFESQPDGGEWRGRVVLVADHELELAQPSSYESVMEAVMSGCALAGLQTRAFSVRSTGVSPTLSVDENRAKVRESITTPLLAALDEGCALVDFEGHGNYDYLSRQWVLRSQDVTGLRNGVRLPVVTLVTCFAGAFDYPLAESGKCLAAQLLLAPTGGAIAVIGPTRLGGDCFDVPFFGQLFQAREHLLGEPFARAKVSMTQRQAGLWDRVENYNLLGDPATRLRFSLTPIRPPEGGGPVEPWARPPERVERGTDADGDLYEDLLAQEFAKKKGSEYYEEYVPLEVHTQRPLSDRELAALEQMGARIGRVYGEPPFGFSGGLPWSRLQDLKKVLGPNFRWAQLADIYFRDPTSGVLPVRVPKPPGQ